MPRNLRSRTLPALAAVLDDQPPAIDEITSDEDRCSVQTSSEDEYDPSGENSSESASEVMDVDEDDLENASLEQRLLDAHNRRESRGSNGVGRPTSVLRGKSGYKWSTKAPERMSDRSSPTNGDRIPGPVGPAANLTILEEFWEVLMTDEIFEKIVLHTNKQIEHVCASMMASNQLMQSYHNLTDIVEIKALIGLFYYAGSRKDSNVDVHKMWDKRHGISVYRCTMPRMRFTFLCMCLRFDDKETRNKDDRLAAIREIWTIFITNCMNCYNASSKTTVDEQLLSFRGRCIFRIYIKSKPDKYGLKLITLNDAETSYLIFAIPYLGKEKISDMLPGEKNPEYFFRKVTEPIHGSGRTVTCDNWFTSIPLIDRFVENPYNLTITGTVRKNKVEVPAQMKLASKQVPHTSFCFSKNMILLSFTPKQNKIVLVASSYCKSTEITDGKPNVILHYNQTKGGTDCFDQLCHAYTTAMRTNRWPMRFFLGMLDQAAVNARILFRCFKRNTKDDDSLTAFDCLQDLSMHLLKPYLLERVSVSSLRTDLRLGIKMILGLPEEMVVDEERPYLETKTRCGLCSRKNDKKTKEQCPSCRRAMCNNHRVYLCVECADTD